MKYFYSVAALLLVTYRLSAQAPDFNIQQPTIAPKAPNSAMIERFGNYQVNLFSGLADISIPLYTIKTSSFEIPVTLAYHPSGMRVTDFPGWVGLGWALNAGGEITRALVGNEDESPNGYFNRPVRDANSIYPNDTDTQYILDVNNGVADFGADMFNYNFPGHSGKFSHYLDSDNIIKPLILPFSPIRITRNMGGATGMNFQINDELGKQYHFGQNYVEISISNFTASGAPIGPFPLRPITTAWMLEKMVAADKRDSVTFSYYQQHDKTPNEYNDTWTVTDESDNTLAETGTYPVNHPYDDKYQISTTDPNVNTDLYSQSLQEIDFKNGKVIFELASTARQDFGQTNTKALQDIKVYSTTNGSDQLLRTIKFFYSYFQPTNPAAQRLRLDSVQVLDATSNKINTYRFDYNNTVNLPEWNSRSKDLWGYFNNKSNTSLVPQQTIPYLTYGVPLPSYVTIGSTTADGRVSDAAAMQANILNRIHYPTGGFSDFEYEANQYDGGTGTAVIAGGLRIKSIKNYTAPDATPITKFYKYGANESGLGRANFYLNRFIFNDDKQHGFYQRIDIPVASYDKTATQRVRNFFSNPTISIQPADGAPITYSRVAEYTGNGSDVTGKTIYVFRDTPDLVQGYSNVGGKDVVITLLFDRSQILSKKDYRLTSGSYYPIEDVEYRYNTSSFPVKIVNNGIVIMQQTVRDNYPDIYHPYPPGSLFSDFQWVNYVTVADDNYRIATTKTTYDGSDTTRSVVSTTTTAYNNFAHQQPSLTTTTDSKSDIVVQHNTYPADFIPAGNTVTGNTVLDNMIGRNMQAASIERYVTLQRPSSTAGTIGGEITQYKILPTNLPVPDVQSRLAVSTPLSNYAPATVNSGTLQIDSRYYAALSFDSYDTDGNLTTITKETGPHTGYLWGYNGAYPIAQITNAPVKDIFYDGFEGGDGKSALNDSKTGHYSYSGSYSKTLTGLDNGSYTLTYWLKSGSTWALQTSAVTVTAGSYTISVTGQIDDVRFYPAAAQMVTYTYDPLIGETSISDAKSVTTYYEYDAFARLRAIRDKDNNIVKSFCYNYAGQSTNCFVPSFGGGSTIVYARLEYGSSNFSSAPNFQGAYDYTDTEDLYIRFYSDAACTVPLVLTSSLVVPVMDNGTFWDNPSFSYSYSTGSNSYTVPSGVSSYYLGAQTISYEHTFYDSFGSFWDNYDSWTYYLGTGSGYTIEF